MRAFKALFPRTSLPQSWSDYGFLGTLLGSQVRDLGTIIADKKAYGLLLSSGFERAFEALKAKESKIDRYSKTLEEAAEALLELTREPLELSKSPGEAKVLGDIKQRVDYILSKNMPQDCPPKR